MEIARVHIRFFGAGAFIRGNTMIDWYTNFNSFGQYKRMWSDMSGVGIQGHYKVDDQRINILKDCAFITFIPVGLGTKAPSGDMDHAISMLGLYNVIGAALPRLMSYGYLSSPLFREHITEVAFLTAWEEAGDANGEMSYQLNGVVHPDQRLMFAVEAI